MFFSKNFIELESFFYQCAVESEIKQEDHQINHIALSYLPDSCENYKQFIFIFYDNGSPIGYLHLSICIQNKRCDLEHIYVLHSKRSKKRALQLIDEAVSKIFELNIEIKNVHTTRLTSGGERCFNYLKARLINNSCYI